MEKKKNTKTEPKPIKKKTVAEEKKVTKKTTRSTKKALLDKKDQKVLKVLSRIVNIIARVLKVCSMIILPIIAVTLIIIPLIFKDIKVGGNIIHFDDARIVLNDDYITVNIADKTYLLADNVRNIPEIINYLNSNSLNKLVTSIELLLLFAAVIIAINTYLLKDIEKLFYNFYKNETPFTEENTNYIHRIGHIMIIILATSVVISVTLSLCVDPAFIKCFPPYGIFTIIITYIMYYIFIYATKLQKANKTVIYD